MKSESQRTRVTVRNIAQRLGVSHSTVSRALHDDPRITEPLRQRVRQTADALGYRPDPMLAALAQYRLGKDRKQISAALAWINSWPEPEKLRAFKEFDLYWRGASQEAERAGYRLEEFHCPKEIPTSRLARVLRARGIRGILLTPGWAGETPDWESFPWEHFSVVRFGYSLKSPPAHVVTSDQLMDGMLAFERIWNLGYRRIAMVTSKVLGTRLVRFSAGYLYAQLKVQPNLRFSPYLMEEPFTGREQERFADWLKIMRPDVILTDIGPMRDMLRGTGYRVPRDIGLAALSVLDGGVDAGINQNSEEIGSAAVQLLISLIHHNEGGVPDIPREVLIAGRWVNGVSLPAKATTADDSAAASRVGLPGGHKKTRPVPGGL